MFRNPNVWSYGSSLPPSSLPPPVTPPRSIRLQSLTRQMMAVGYMGPPVAAGKLGELVGRLFDVANRDGSHQLTWKAGYRHDMDMYEVVATCRDCNTTWKHGSTMSMMYMGDYILAELVPWLGDIMREECGLAVKRILLAEYVTEQLAAAGAAGVALVDLIGALIVDLEAPGGDVADMIRRLGFEEFFLDDVSGSGVGVLKHLRLPEGHPMREGW